MMNLMGMFPWTPSFLIPLQKSKKKIQFNDLHINLINKIFSFLSLQDILVVRTLNRQFSVLSVPDWLIRTERMNFNDLKYHSLNKKEAIEIIKKNTRSFKVLDFVSYSFFGAKYTIKYLLNFFDAEFHKVTELRLELPYKRFKDRSGIFNLTDEDLSQLVKKIKVACPSLKKLLIKGALVIDQPTIFLRELDQLECFTLIEGDINKGVVKALNTHKKLKTVSLCLETSGRGLVSEINKLIRLELFGTKLSDLENLSRCNQLQHLRLKQCYETNDEMIARLLLNLPQLRQLELIGCPNLTTGLFRSLSNLKQLQQLTLHEFGNVSKTDSSTYWGSMYTRIKAVNADDIGYLSQCPSLTDITLEQCEDFDDQAIAAFSKLPHLRKFTFIANRQCKVYRLGVDLMNFNQLEYLNVSIAFKRDRDLQGFFRSISMCRKLKIVDFSKPYELIGSLDEINETTKRLKPYITNFPDLLIQLPQRFPKKAIKGSFEDHFFGDLD